MTGTAMLDPGVRNLLLQAAEWHALEMLFQCPSPEWKHHLADLRREIAGTDVAKAMELAIDEASEGTFHSILGPGGPAPAREVSYREIIQLGYLMSELTTYYDAFAFRPATSEVTDHVSVEAGFMGFLRLKEAFALVSGDQERASIAREAAERFRKEHLSYIAEPLSAILDNSGEPYLEVAGRALLSRTGPREKQIFEILDQEQAAGEDSIFDCGAP
jgi:nitrate reductase assembly molybdenum cofactor insertion protein NarJ